MKKTKEELDYDFLIISLFKCLVDIYGVEKAIILIYKVNSVRGVKI